MAAMLFSHGRAFFSVRDCRDDFSIFYSTDNNNNYTFIKARTSSRSPYKFKIPEKNFIHISSFEVGALCFLWQRPPYCFSVQNLPVLYHCSQFYLNELWLIDERVTYFGHVENACPVRFALRFFSWPLYPIQKWVRDSTISCFWPTGKSVFRALKSNESPTSIICPESQHRARSESVFKLILTWLSTALCTSERF